MSSSEEEVQRAGGRWITDTYDILDWRMSYDMSADSRPPVTPAAWDAIQQETCQRVLGLGEALGAVLRDLARRYKGLGHNKQRALRQLVTRRGPAGK